jgi:hypothetical protein
MKIEKERTESLVLSLRQLKKPMPKAWVAVEAVEARPVTEMPMGAAKIEQVQAVALYSLKISFFLKSSVISST